MSDRPREAVLIDKSTDSLAAGDVVVEVEGVAVAAQGAEVGALLSQGRIVLVKAGGHTLNGKKCKLA